MPNAWEIINQLSNQQNKSTELLSGLMESSFNTASKSIAQQSNILNTITSSALNYRQTLIDEHYKSESLKLQEKSQNALASYRDAELANRDRQLDIQEQRYKDLDERERIKTEQAKNNGEALKFLKLKSDIYDDSISVLGRDMDRSLREKGVLMERLDRLPINALPSERKNLEQQIQALDNNIKAKDDEKFRLGSDRLKISTEGEFLQSGISTPEESFDRLNKGLQHPIGRQGSDSTPPTPSSSTASYDDSTGGEGFTEVGYGDPDDVDKYDLGDSLRITQAQLHKDPGNYPVIQDFIQNRADGKTKSYFAAKKLEKEKEWFKNGFANQLLGEDAKKFELNDKEFKNEYYYYGGTPESFNKLNNDISDKISEVKELGTLAEKKAKVNELLAKQFQLQVPTLPVAKSGGQMTPKTIGLDGSLNVKRDERTGEVLSVDVQDSPVPLTQSQVDDKDKKESDDILRVALFGIDRNGKQVAKKSIFSLTKEGKGSYEISKFGDEVLQSVTLNDFIKARLSSNRNFPGYGQDQVPSEKEMREYSDKERRRIIKYLYKPENKNKAVQFFTDYYKNNLKMIKE